MKYIKENEVLQKQIDDKKSDIMHAQNGVRKYNATLHRSDVSTEHWGELLEKMKAQYGEQEKQLKAAIELADKKCAEAEELKSSEFKDALSKNLGKLKE